MWSFEKIHRCMAHLFLGQLVSTFDEEFRILFAQSQPLMMDNVPAPMEDFNPLQKRPFPRERTPMYRDPRKFHPDDERTDMDWRMMPLKRRGSLNNPADLYKVSRFPSQHSLIEPSSDQGHSRMAIMDNPAFKRHSYAEGGHGRYSYPFLQQQELPDLETQGRHFDRGQQSHARPGPEANYGGYDKFWSQDKTSHSPDEYSDPGLPQDTENFDPVLNYLASTRNVEFDEGSDNLLPAADLPSSSYPRRLSLDQAYACQISPTPSNPTDQKQFFPPSSDRKDPMVKRGLRNYRLSSYLSAFDNPGDEGLPLPPDSLEEPSNPAIPMKTSGVPFSVPKIPQFREFKVPALRRASQMPSYVKPVREQSKKLPDEGTSMAEESKTTPTPSESSSTTEGDKTEEAEQKEPKTGVVRREESFRRKYNVAIPRSSRLRSSLIFSSLDQQTQDTAAEQQDEEGDKNEAEQAKTPFYSQMLAQKRSAAREPFEWSRYIKSATFDSSGQETSKPDDGTSKTKDDNSKNPPENPEAQESLKHSDVGKANDSPSVPRSSSFEDEMAKTDQLLQPTKSLLTPFSVDMNDPDERLKFFKEMAAKRKAAKTAEAEKSALKAPMKVTTDYNVNNETKKQDSQNNSDPSTSTFSEEEQTRVSTDSEKIEMKNSKSADTKLTQDTKLSKPAVKESSPCQSPTTTNETAANLPCLMQGTDNSENSSPQTTPSPTASSFTPLPTPAETVSSNITQEDSDSIPTSSILSPISDKIDGKECVGPSLPESAQSTVEASQTDTAASDVQTGSTQALLDSVLKPISPTVDYSHVEFDISPDTCAAGSVPSTLESTTNTKSEEFCWASSDSQKHVLESEISPIAEGSSVLTSPKHTEADSLSSSSAQWCSPIVSDLESSHSKADQKEAIPDERSETGSVRTADIPPDASQSETSPCSQDAPTLTNPPSELNLSGSDSPTPAETISCSSPLSESAGSVMSPEAEKTETNMPVLHSSSDAISFSGETSIDSNKAVHPTESSFSPTEPTSTVTSVTKEHNLPIKRSESVTSESHTSESSVPADISFTDECESFEEANDQAGQNYCSEVESGEVAPQSEKPKSTQSRYHSSTAKVLSSSNLRDDTKLLLGQISANSQNRNELNKELPVTDDEKEDKADKNAKREKERGIRSFGRGQPKTAAERKELLEKIQTMRKENKVYSRFEVRIH